MANIGHLGIAPRSIEQARPLFEQKSARTLFPQFVAIQCSWR
jgi:hypothetical protein